LAFGIEERHEYYPRLPHGKDVRVLREVLIVDDDPDILEIVTEALRDEGFHVAAFGDGAHALAYAHDHIPAVVLTDLLIPPMGGEELILGLRALHGDALPIVVMTAMTDRSRLAGVPVDEVLDKPFELEDLSAIIHRWARPAQDGVY
jgi:two-component system OmpR family response regulator